MSWNEKKRHANTLERRLDELLGQYSLVRVDKGDPLFVSSEEKELEVSIGSLLGELSTALDAMGTCNDKPATWNAQASRLREIMYDKRAGFRSAQNKLKQLREAESLRRYMHSGRGVNGNDDQEADAAERILMKEHGHIANSSAMADDIIDQATQVNSELRRQRNQFLGAGSRLGEVGRMIPGVNTLIQRIQDKRTRDNTILAIVIGICTCFMLWYWLSGWGI